VKLTSTELAYVRSRDLHVTEKCDGCAKLLNQTVRYTISGRPEVYCSAACRDSAFFGDRREAKKAASPGKCAYCGGRLERKKPGAIFCDDVCRKRFSRTKWSSSTGESQESRTPTQSNQWVADAKLDRQGNRITGASELSRSALRGLPMQLRSPVEVERDTLGSHGS
jgi:hypothetical protein